MERKNYMFNTTAVLKNLQLVEFNDTKQTDTEG
jgi:hypothetical protein